MSRAPLIKKVEPRKGLWARLSHKRPRVAGLLLMMGVPLLLLLILEVSLRLAVGDVVYNSEVAALRDSFPNPESIELADPPLWVTDEHGLFVANRQVVPAVNSEGYRTPEFDAPTDGRAKVLFLGDSFTWGLSADPVIAAFPDIVTIAGYSSINLGIPGAAPADYLARAELYIPALKPDIVAVMFYPGNDFERVAPVVPGMQRWFVTDQAYLRAVDFEGNPVSFEEARSQHLSLFGNNVRASILRAFLRTAIGSTMFRRFLSTSDSEVVVQQKLARIKEIAEESGATFMLFMLPVRPEFRTRANSTDFFDDLNPRAPDDFGPERYAPLPDQHLNNDGHLAVAVFIVEQLIGAGFIPQPDVPG